MRNKKRPFFYQEKKTIWPIFLLFIIGIAIFSIWSIRVPRIRQLFGWHVIDAQSYAKSLLIPVHTPNPLLFRIPTIYPTIEMPPEQVIFAENLENINLEQDRVDQSPLVTPTPGIAWIIKTQRPVSESIAAPDEEDSKAFLIPPVFEHQDFQNDGPAVLSAAIRFYGKTESQYLIAKKIKPDYFDPFVSFEEMETYLHEIYPDLGCQIRINGNTNMLERLVFAGYPVIIRIEREKTFPAWDGDDLKDSRYIFITGLDKNENRITYQDPFIGDRINDTYDQIMADWYAYQRKYMVVYPKDDEWRVQQIFGDQWEKDYNFQSALQKFRKDAEMLPQNVYAWLNIAVVLAQNEQYEEAWNTYRSIQNLSIPQRFFLYNPSLYAAAFHTGNADELGSYADYSLKINAHSEESWLWKGWAMILRNQEEEAAQCFRKALSIKPDYQDALYAVEFLKK